MDVLYWWECGMHSRTTPFIYWKFRTFKLHNVSIKSQLCLFQRRWSLPSPFNKKTAILQDYWRYTPSGANRLAESAGLEVNVPTFFGMFFLGATNCFGFLWKMTGGMIVFSKDPFFMLDEVTDHHSWPTNWSPWQSCSSTAGVGSLCPRILAGNHRSLSWDWPFTWSGAETVFLCGRATTAAVQQVNVW